MHGSCWHGHAYVRMCDMHVIDGTRRYSRHPNLRSRRMLNMVRQSLFMFAPLVCLSAHAGSIRMGTMPPPALLPAICLMDLQPAVHPVDPQPPLLPAARRVDPQPLLQPAPLPAPCAVVPQPQPQPAPQPALQPLPQPAAPLHMATPDTANSTTPAQVMVPAGLHVYLGHGVMPLPQRLLSKILNLEFVEMQDLLPEAWLTSIEDDAAKCCSTSDAEGRKRRPPVTNIFTWLQGFASMVSALSTKYPRMVPEFLAYQSTIIKCYKDYDSTTGHSGGRWPSPRVLIGLISMGHFTACVSQERRNAAPFACIASVTTTCPSAAQKPHPLASQGQTPSPG